MDPKEEIPCTTCKLWNAQAKAFSCNPNKCRKLSEWLLERVSQFNANAKDHKQVPEAPIHYII